MARIFKVSLGFVIYTLTALLVFAVAATLWAVKEFKAAGPLENTIIIEIPRGSSLGTITGLLDDQGALRHPHIFRYGVRAMKQGSNLQAGEYEIQPGMSAQEIMTHLTSGKVVQRQFTVREGLTSYETVRVINAVPELRGIIEDTPAEGSLLPETYSYSKDEPRSAVIKRMQAAMTDIHDYLVGKDPHKVELCVIVKTLEPESCWRSILTLASIVEKETAVADERKKVAGVFMNRLRIGMALQTDPTVIYAITEGKHQNDGKGPLGRRLLTKDLEFDSPYNTYKYPGLPPGPIANPGKAAIEAVLDPEAHDFIYFVADGTGGHAFAKTLDEHNANVAQWRKIRRSQQ